MTDKRPLIVICAVGALALVLYIVGSIVWFYTNGDGTSWYVEDRSPVPNRQIGFRKDGVVVWRFSTNNPAKK